MRKTALLFALVLGGAALFTGCREDEKLDLAGYPQTPVGIVVSDAKTPTVTLKGTYQNTTGDLQLDGIPTRTYVFTLPQASPEDVTLYLEPLAVNIPADKVSMDVTEIHIPAGQVSATNTVTVTLADNDFSFMSDIQDAVIYEIGVRVVDVKGFNTPMTQTESKVIIEKEAYTANCSISGVNGRKVTFNRGYWDGEILNPDPMSYEIKAYLDKPAKSDVKVSLAGSGIAEQFMKDMSITPAELIIPAGSLESSQAAVWTLTDDFLLTTDQPEKHQVLVKSGVSSDDQTVKTDAGKDVLTIDISKALEAVALADAIGTDWTEFSRTGWVGKGGGQYGYGKPENLLKNQEVDGNHFWLDIDMLEAKAMAGFSLRASSATYSAKEVVFHISEDNVNWTSIGTMHPAALGTQYYKMLAPLTTRYLRLEIMEGYATGNSYGSSWLYDFKVYGATN